MLFLDPVEGRYLEELGGMNVFLVYKDGTLVTPEPVRQHPEGITRESILQLARDRGMKVEERKVSIDEWKDDQRSVCLAALRRWSPRSASLKGEGFSVATSTRRPARPMSLRKELTDIQYGRLPDRHNWLVKLG